MRDGIVIVEGGEDHLLCASGFPHRDSEWPHTLDPLLKRDDLSSRLNAYRLPAALRAPAATRAPA